MRLISDGREESFDDTFFGSYTGRVDDFVLQRNDGVPAYNLAVVVDDAAQGVTEVVRGDDLLASTPRQIMLHRLLDLPLPQYAHVPLVLAPDGSERELEPGKTIVAGDAVVIPPVDTKQRHYDKVLGKFRLEMGNGYGIHGTPEGLTERLERTPHLFNQVARIAKRGRPRK